MGKVKFQVNFHGQSTANVIVKDVCDGKVDTTSICRIYNLPVNDYFKTLVGQYISKYAPKGKDHLNIGWYWEEQENPKLVFIRFQKTCLTKKEVFAAIKEGYEFFACIANYCYFLRTEHEKQLITAEWCDKINKNNL